MWIKVRTSELKRNISIPIPLGLAGTVVNLIPERVLARARADMPEEFRDLLTKRVLSDLIWECRRTLGEYKGLELVHVESANGELVSIVA